MTFGSDGRGVSDTIGFVFVFALIIGSTGVVYTVGYGGLQDARNFEQVNNAERAFDVLGENVEDLRRDGAPSRSTGIKLGGAALRSGDPIQINVTATHETNPAYNVSTGPIDLTPVVYDSGHGSRIRYVDGAIIRSDGSGSVMVRDPELVLGQARTMITVLWTESSSSGGVAGRTTAYVRTERQYTDVLLSESRGTYDTVEIWMATPHWELWQGFFESQGAACTHPPSSETISCTVSDVDQAYVTLVKIAVEIS